MRPLILYLLIMCSIVLTAFVILRVIPRLKTAVFSGESGRRQALDGLRGILALSVMIHHTMLGYLLHDNVTEDTLRANGFINQLGSASVALFFMISAFLFGGKLLRNGGQLSFSDLIYGRLMRIVPLYVIAVAIVVFIALAWQDFYLVVPTSELANEIVRHLMFDFVSRYTINGFNALNELGSVWTLRFEWVFYLALPVMALLYRMTRQPLLLYLPLMALAIVWDPRCYFFLAGLAVSQLATFDGPRARITWQVAAVFGLLILLLRYYASSGATQAILMIPVLVAVVQQHRWIALLGTRPFRYLGEISFSIYLLHGTVIFLFMAATKTHWRDVGDPGFVIAVWIIGFCTIIFSTVTFLLVEKPLMHKRMPG